MDDMTAVEHVQRHIRTNRKPRTALLTEVFGRGELTSSALSGKAWLSPCSNVIV